MAETQGDGSPASEQPSARTVTIQCGACGLDFSYLRNGPGRPRIFCSNKCAVKRRTERLALPTQQCRTCGKEYRPHYYGAGFCSVPCRTNGRVYETRSERDMAKWHRRRARMAGTGYERIARPSIYKRDGWICGICKGPVDPSLKAPDPMSASLDHIVPLAKGGAHSRSNVQCAHWICNSRKGDRLAA